MRFRKIKSSPGAASCGASQAANIAVKHVDAVIHYARVQLAQPAAVCHGDSVRGCDDAAVWVWIDCTQ